MALKCIIQLKYITEAYTVESRNYAPPPPPPPPPPPRRAASSSAMAFSPNFLFFVGLYAPLLFYCLLPLCNVGVYFILCKGYGIQIIICNQYYSVVTHIQWAYGVTCWEIFSGGKVPYAEFTVKEIPKLLGGGYRLERPSNCASNEQM